MDEERGEMKRGGIVAGVLLGLFSAALVAAATLFFAFRRDVPSEVCREIDSKSSDIIAHMDACAGSLALKAGAIEERIGAMEKKLDSIDSKLDRLVKAAVPDLPDGMSRAE